MCEGERDGEGGRAMMVETMYKGVNTAAWRKGERTARGRGMGIGAAGGCSVAAGDGSGCERVARVV